jgi:hypothetical protein
LGAEITSFKRENKRLEKLAKVKVLRSLSLSLPPGATKLSNQ